MPVRIQEEDFDLSREVHLLSAGTPSVGAVATFVGIVRGNSEEQKVTALDLQHYPGMTEKALQSIAEEAKTRWLLHDVLVVHRVGHLCAGDQIVLVAVAAEHRSQAFDACHFVVDYLKTRAPFWKKEHTEEGARWVDARESDDVAALRWKPEK